MVREAWINQPNWTSVVNAFQDLVGDWNRKNFGNNFYKKRRLMARLEGIDRACAVGGNGHLKHLQHNLWKEYQDILNQEELFWYQRAKQDWIKFGDRNTKFFHLSTLVKRRRNSIEALIADNGEMVFDYR